MTSPTARRMTVMDLAAHARPKKRSLLIASGVLALLGVAAPDGGAKTALFVASACVAGVLMVLGLVWVAQDRNRRRERLAITRFIENDLVPSFVTGDDGTLIYANQAAKTRCDGAIADTLAATLRPVLANPNVILHRLRAATDSGQSAFEELVSKTGQIRISARRIEQDQIVWRFEDLGGQIAAPATALPQLPMLVLARGDTIVSMNDAARDALGADLRHLDRVLGPGRLRGGVMTQLNTPNGRQDVVPYRMNAESGRSVVYLLPAEDREKVEGWQAIEELPVPLLRVSVDGYVRAFNSSAAGLLGSSLTEDVLLSDLMEGLGRSISDWLRDTTQGRSSQNSEFLRLKRSDKEIFVQVTLNTLQTPGGMELIAVLSDATEVKTLEARFVQSQKMQAIGQLAGGVAHDFNNLLTAISGHCDLLLLRHDQGDPDYADLVQINQNANRAAALVSQLLAFSRKQTLRPKTIDMRDTLADLTHLLNRLVGERISLKTSYDPMLPPIRADKRQLEQVLMNLVVNARDAMPNGGEIRVNCEAEDLTEPLSRDNATVPAGPYVRVTVADDGVGIPQDKLKRVFEPFYTTKRTDEGTGLGLSTAYGIVKQTGGFIFVDSIVGTGTTFSVYLPAQDSADQTADEPSTKHIEKTAPAHGDGVILLVEDEAPVRAFASRALRLRGYTVLEADSAEAALETLADETLEVDVFVTDVVMPGMDGPTWVKQALQSRPETRVVFVSGYAEDSFGETQARIPNSVFLPKPFSLTDLAETVHRQLHHLEIAA